MVQEQSKEPCIMEQSNDQGVIEGAMDQGSEFEVGTTGK
jgi:hypothetical protein